MDDTKRRMLISGLKLTETNKFLVIWLKIYYPDIKFADVEVSS